MSNNNNEKILFVDDEPNILQSMERQLRKRFSVTTALSGDDALRVMKEEGPFAVIVSDMRMPGMDGVQLLSRVKDLYPDTVRMMLTGNADQDTAVEAVNSGQIFRFLSKPCATPTLITSLALALRQYRLINAERDLLNNTLKGSIKVLTELLSLANAPAFSSGYRIKEAVKKIATILELPNIWQYEVAALMSQIGCVTLPIDILTKLQSGIELSSDEIETFRQHPAVGKKLVAQIPRLEKVAEIIAFQLKPYDEYLEETDIDDDVETGAQILKAVIDYDLLLHQGIKHQEALNKLLKRKGAYNPEILDLLKQIEIQSVKVKILSVKFSDIVPGMIVEEDVIASNGALIIPKGQEVTWPVLEGLQNFIKHIGIQEPIRVRVPEGDPRDQLTI